MKTLAVFIDKNDRYNFDSYSRDEIGDGAYWSELRRSETGKYGIIPFCSHGDYDNSCHVERSNYRVFMEMFGSLPGIYPVYGHHDSRAILVDIDMHANNQDMIDVIAGLYDYPCIDEEDMANMEFEMQSEAWDNYLAADFRSALEDIIRKELELDDFDDVPEISDEKLVEIRDVLMDQTNTYFQIEAGGNIYLDINRVVKAFTIDMIE